ncbi:DUF7278 family profilin-like fold-containing protein [Candidatus Enterococcus huntleyi]|uniref:DUF7278 family profilin-like fold-containing protein n=1 Tax=Candidatus Enterococcus huntleyi TaxID=1857217 RepID=UPI00137A26CA|nr:hypothetical protein [Enterococcus sp. JM4C]
MYYVSPLVKVSDVTLVEYELAGIKCSTFEFLLDGEAFVFVPGNDEAILGWDSGVQGLPVQEVMYEPDTTEESAMFREFKQIYEFETIEDFSDYVNDFTTPLRKAVIPPMLVQKRAMPVSARYLGEYQTVTAQFSGDQQAVASFLPEVKQQLSPQLTLEESLTWTFPRSLYQEERYYLEMSMTEDTYAVYQHIPQTHQQLIKEVQAKGFDLLNEDQWEYIVGAGTRRIFRWGNDLLSETSPWAHAVKERREGPNMFGLLVDTTKSRHELTQDPAILKLDSIEETGCPLIDCLPLSSYYQSGRTLEIEEILRPQELLYRKVILIEQVE